MTVNGQVWLRRPGKMRWVDQTSMQVRESILVDVAGNTNRFTFSNTNLAATPPAKKPRPRTP